MSKTYKDKPDKYLNGKQRHNINKKPKDRRFVSSKGRDKENLKNDIEDYINNSFNSN